MNEYDEGRIWFKKKGGVVTVGLTEKAFEEIGNVQTINLPVEGDDFSQDDVSCEIEGEKGSFEVVCPVDGSVVAINEALNDDQDLLLTDPLDEGWLFKVRVVSDNEDEDSEEE